MVREARTTKQLREGKRKGASHPLISYMHVQIWNNHVLGFTFFFIF